MRILVYGIYPLVMILVAFRLGEALFWSIKALL